jgi:N-acetylglucosaminyl-diphospho-decaprenol L-rhamnosyltransferase
MNAMTKSCMRLLIVIVSYRVTDLTIECLRSVANQIQDIPGVRVAVCENGTSPEAAKKLRETIDLEGWHAWTTLTVISPNRGFTGGNNVVLREAMESGSPPQYFFLLNADTILRHGALAALVRFMDTNPKVGITGSRLESLDGVPRSTAFRFFSIASEFEQAIRLQVVSRMLEARCVTSSLPVQPTQTDWVSGAAMIIRREVLVDIGLLDEDLYTYFDDIDVCMRAMRAGWSTWLLPSSQVVHLEGQSTGVTQRQARPKRRPDYWFEARRLFWLKSYGAVYTAMADAVWIIGRSIWHLRGALQGKENNDPPLLLWDFIRHSVWVKGFRKSPVRNPALD